MDTFDANLLDAAKAVGSATVHEAAGRIGALPPAITPVDSAWRIAGPALTVSSPPGDNLWLHRAIYSASAGDVLVVATGTTQRLWGYWGEIMSIAARQAGLAGLVLEGGSRDHGQLLEVGFPVFSLGTCIRGTIKDKELDYGRIGGRVRIGNVVVCTGDLMVGDADGVVAIPADRAGEAVAAAAARETKEAVLKQQLRAGARTLDLLDLTSSDDTLSGLPLAEERDNT